MVQLYIHGFLLLLNVLNVWVLGLVYMALIFTHNDPIKWNVVVSVLDYIQLLICYSQCHSYFSVLYKHIHTATCHNLCNILIQRCRLCLKIIIHSDVTSKFPPHRVQPWSLIHIMLQAKLNHTEPEISSLEFQKCFSLKSVNALK